MKIIAWLAGGYLIGRAVTRPTRPRTPHADYRSPWGTHGGRLLIETAAIVGALIVAAALIGALR